MKLIHKTTSLCNECYRHIPGNVVEQDNQIVLIKRCPEHGEQRSVVETDTEFYYSLEHHSYDSGYNMILFDVTDRCQLNCPHCYHLPDNKIKDTPIDQVVAQVAALPHDWRPMMAGAEPTMRKDFVELCAAIRQGRESISVLTNGLRFSDRDFAQQCFDAGLDRVAIGLNHRTYQGDKIHNQQLTGIRNLLDIGYHIGYVGFTIETLDHVPDILTEIEGMAHANIGQFRIRCGSFIGRSNDQQRSYLSNLVRAVNDHYGQSLQRIGPDDNPYHCMLQSPMGARLRLIQWPDVTNIDLEELASGPWCQFYDGPVTNFVHQVITRDAYKNEGLPALDFVPARYQYRPMHQLEHHWKHGWTGPMEIDENQLDWSYIEEPKRRFKVIKMLDNT